MIYQINESRLDEVIMNYLDSVFFGMEEHHDAIGGGIYRWWGIGNHGMLDTSVSGEGTVGVGINESIYNTFRSMFSLNPIQADLYIMRWVEDNLELSAEELYTF